MRLLLVALLLTAPLAAAMAPPRVTAPELAEAGAPLALVVCLDAPAELRVALTLDGQAASRNGSRYGPARPAGCSNVTIDVLDVAGNATLLVRARNGSRTADATATVEIVRAAPPRFASDDILVNGSWTAFATPDAGDAPVLALIDGAQRQVLVEGYTLANVDIASALADAAARGVAVRVLLDGSPVGGFPAGEPGLLAALRDAGARVAILKGARFATLHAKVIVADRERVLVSTENFHASSYPPIAGTPGTRGFGLLVENASLAASFARVLDADAAERGAVAPPNAPAAVLTRAAARSAGPVMRVEGAWNATMVLSPDSSGEVRALLDRATRRIDVAMLFADERNDTMLDGLVDAARRGVQVRLLLDASVDDGRNAADVARLGSLARDEGVPLEAKLADPRHTLHAKLVLVDDASFYVGSMNWGNASIHKNREAGLVVDAPPLASSYEAVFERDWAPPAQERRVEAAPLAELVLGLGLSLGLASLTSRRRP